MANITSTIEVITPEKAAEYINHNVHNRKLNKGQVAYYARMMSEGKWALNGQAIVFDTKGNLLDGQHRLHAVIMANVSIVSVVIRNIDEGAFPTFDQGRARTAGDVLSVKGIDERTKNSTLRVFRRMILNDKDNPKGTRMADKYKTQLLIKCWEAFKKNKEYKILRWLFGEDEDSFK